MKFQNKLKFMFSKILEELLKYNYRIYESFFDFIG